MSDKMHKYLVIASVALVAYAVVAVFQQRVMAIPVVGSALPH